MMTDKAIGLIGCGNMGSALVENFQNKCRPKALFVFDKDQAKSEALKQRLRVTVSRGVNELVSDSDVVIIAVKPKDIAVLLKKMKGFQNKLLISIAAGITLSYIRQFLKGEAAFIRAMPNINALAGLSVTALACGEAVSASDRQVAEEIFTAVGKVVFVKEPQMDAVTAISGSGPAFAAHFLSISPQDQGVVMQVFVQEAEHFHIKPETARVLAEETIAGTLEMLSVNCDAAVLIQRVSSKGGTTEAGMKVLKQKGRTPEALREAIRAAYKRARELHKEEPLV
jgi:pyrroline-5-carboxylate reductase